MIKHKEEISRVLFHMLVFSTLITTNIFLFIFVHNLSDLAPNFALAVVTVPVAIWSLFRINIGKVNTQNCDSSMNTEVFK